MNWKLLVRYLADECTKKERQRVNYWLNEDPKNKEFLQSIIKIWEVKPKNNFEFDAQQARNRFKDKNLQFNRSSNTFEKNSFANSYKQSEKRVAWLMYASTMASVLLLVLLFAYKPEFFGINDGSEQSHLTMQEIITEKGQKTTFTLSDGTMVMLNSESSLRIPATFVNEAREVFLEGEAYFEVSHIEDALFVIHSKNFSTRVLGTKFVVSSYPDDNHPKVVVSEGKVSVNAIDNPTPLAYITPNQLGEFEDDGHVEVEPITNLDEYTGWTSGKLVFNQAPLSEIKNRLERWYDIQININDAALLSRKLTASFDKEPLTEVLKVITISLELEYLYERDTRTISFFNNDQKSR